MKIKKGLLYHIAVIFQINHKRLFDEIQKSCQIN